MITHVAVATKEHEPSRILALRFYFASGNECLYDWPTNAYEWKSPPTPEDSAEAERAVRSVPVVP